MIVRVRGKRWRLVLDAPNGPGAPWGECDPPDKRGKQIRITRGQTDAQQLDTLIHELLHASHWDMDEEAVAETAHDIARVLTRLGWRRAE